MVLIPPLVSDLVKSVWSAPSISIDVLALGNAKTLGNSQIAGTLFSQKLSGPSKLIF